MTMAHEDGAAIDKLIAHYADLLRRGYRATRWQHPQYGVEELMPNGGWKFSAFHPDSPKAAPATPATEPVRPDSE